MNNNVAILHQGFIPKYRRKFYELLSCNSRNCYVVFHGSAPRNEGHRGFHGVPEFGNVKVRNYYFSLRGNIVSFQPVILKVLLGSYDAVVLGHEVKFLSNVIMFYVCKAIGKPVLWWGHGYHIDGGPFSGYWSISGLVSRFKKRLALRGDRYLVYTEQGAEKLAECGMKENKITVVRNTIDMEEQVLLHHKYRNADVLEIRKRYKLRSESVVLLYLGRIIKEKEVEELLYLVERLNVMDSCRSFVEAVVIGKGPELDKIRKMGTESGGIHILGEIDDEDTIAQYMRVSAALVIPGIVGLAVNYAFAHGVPVITRQRNYQPPEVVYIVSGTNGLVIDGDFNAFVDEMVRYVNSDEDQEKLADGALKTRHTLTIDFMVRAFDEGVSKAIREKRERTGKN